MPQQISQEEEGKAGFFTREAEGFSQEMGPEVREMNGRADGDKSWRSCFISPRDSHSVPGKWEPTEESVWRRSHADLWKQNSTGDSEGPLRRCSEGS